MANDRLLLLREELKSRERVTRMLGLDVERPLKSISDGYPENTITLVGKSAERLLKELWAQRQVAGNPEGRALNELIKGVRDHIESNAVLDALADIQRLRNRSTHDGYVIDVEDAYLALRRLVTILTWIETASSELFADTTVQANPELAERTRFLGGLYAALDYRLAHRFDLSGTASYLLFERAVGLRSDYVEILLGTNKAELLDLLDRTAGELLRTNYPKLTRFVLLQKVNGDIDFPVDSTILAYQDFLDTIVDSKELAAIAANRGVLAGADRSGDQRLQGDLLELDPTTLTYDLRHVPDVRALVAERCDHMGANLLLIGAAGMGKTQLLILLAQAEANDGRYRFYIDLSDRGDHEPVDELISRQLGECFRVPRVYVWNLFLYLIRSGKCVCLLDAVDEAVPGGSVSDIVELFGDLSALLSASSTTIVTSRQSFLLDTPYVRQLLDSRALVSEKLSSRLVSEGIDPLALPHFSAIRIDGLVEAPGLSPLRKAIGDQLGESGSSLLADVLAVFDAAARDADITRRQLVEALGPVSVRGISSFALLELVDLLGVEIFDGRPSAHTCRLHRLLAPTGDDRLRFRHQVFREAIAAQFILTLGPEDRSLDGQPITDQCRAFVTETNLTAASADDVPQSPNIGPGYFLVGPPGEVWLHRHEQPFALARDPVTVRQFLEFVEVIQAGEATTYQHAAQPADATLEPWYERLRIPGYYSDRTYFDHPATCVSWWAAWAYANWRGTRLPMSLEWELAARGRDGRLFPWGDEADIGTANCADHWANRLLPTWHEWKLVHDRGELRSGYPTAPGRFAGNVSPAACRDMAGNVWEWTTTLLPNGASAVIAGGSYDNPIRAVRCSSRGTYRLRGRSNAVGFRVVENEDHG